MNEVKLTIKNNSGLTMFVDNKQLGRICETCPSGETFVYTFNYMQIAGVNSNSIAFTDPLMPQKGVSFVARAEWSESYASYDPGFQSPFTIATDGSYDYYHFNCKQYMPVMFPPDVMKYGRTVDLTFYKL